MTMQTRLLLCLLLLGLVRFGFSEGLGDEPVDGVVTETYLSGEVQRRYSVNEAGQKHGPFEVFAKDGTVLVKANYKDDLLDGRELRYFPSGKRHMVVTWSRGVLSGRWERFFESGQRKISTSYKRGVQTGKFIQSSEDGKWVLTAKYKDGLLDGALKVKDNGRVTSSQTWKAGAVLAIDGVQPFPRGEAELVEQLAEVWGPGYSEAEGLSDEQVVDATRVMALRRLQTYRALCGLPFEDMELLPKWNDLCDAAAEVCRRLGNITHTPERPADTDDKLYKDGKKGAGNSNLAMGSTLPTSVDQYMDDSDDSNIDRIGHRRWCLNPTMGRTGFGVSGRFSAMWSMDKSGKAPRDVDDVFFPPAGYVPVQMFGSHYAWNITPLGGSLPKEEDVEITIQPLGDFYQPAGKPLEIDYLHIDRGGFGAGATLIFRPAGLAVTAGRAYRCQVSLDGGKSVEYDQFIEFISDPRLARR